MIYYGLRFIVSDGEDEVRITKVADSGEEFYNRLIKGIKQIPAGYHLVRLETCQVEAKNGGNALSKVFNGKWIEDKSAIVYGLTRLKVVRS